MAKVKIKKRKRSLGEHIDGWTKSLKGIPLWFRRMAGSWAYREEFMAALWGEMGEYEVRFSTIVGGLGSIALAIANTWFLPGAVFLVKTKFLLTLVFLFIGIRQLGDLNGPIWWADRFATRAANSYNQTGRFKRYERYSAFARSHSQTAFPLRLDEVAFLCELYHQYMTGTVTVDALCELRTYAPQEVEFFYQVMGFAPSDPRFPPQYLGQPIATRQ